MIIHKGYDDLNLKSPVVTMGIFDGVHRGHRSLLDLLVSRAAEDDGDSVVITFHPHPRIVLEKDNKGLTFLSTMDEKIDLLEKTKIGHLVIIEFTESFSRIKACDFVTNILVSKIGTRHLIVGHDHRFGHRGEGNYETIKECAQTTGFKVEQVRALNSGAGVISSSLIRQSLLKGRVEEASEWLGYNYTLRGSVVEGKKIGRMLGFPTANIRPGDNHKLIPGDGVYAVEVQIDNNKMPGMLSIGTNPTINKNSHTRSVEVNIFDFNKVIYGREVNIIFRYWLREEINFDNTEQLARQMENDKLNARRLLS